MCISGKDFGKGFYLTKSLMQAEAFVKSTIKRARVNGIIGSDVNFGCINMYQITSLDGINEFDFHNADIMWLHYVAGNRKNSLFPDEILRLKKYNVIGGKIANDKTAATLNLYLDFAYGTPGDEKADKACIDFLLPDRLDNQYCFKTNESITKLKFVGCSKVQL